MLAIVFVKHDKPFTRPNPPHGQRTRYRAHAPQLSLGLKPIVLALAMSFGMTVGSAASAANFTVTNLNDAGLGSLRQAIADANAAPGADTITFAAGLSGSITLTTGQLTVTDSVTIQGPGSSVLTVSGNNASRVLELYSGLALLDITISGLTIAHGFASIGAGIANVDEILTLDDVTLADNHATSDGGALWLDGFSMVVTVRNSVITGNTAGQDGGGVYVEDTGGPMLFQNTVFSNNQAGRHGGGIYFYDPDQSVTIDSSTISGNVAGQQGGGIFVYDTNGGPFTVRNSTISGNQAQPPAASYKPVMQSSRRMAGAACRHLRWAGAMAASSVLVSEAFSRFNPHLPSAD
jgi:parallel beta-helix repeat protein